jgi:Cof subfamily protein (haloacid dehalogenase superfamily)
MTPQRLSGVSVLATDLDGTLLRPDGSISDNTRAAIAAAHDRGVRTLFVTGRPPRWMAPVVAATGRSGISVCANGAVTVDLSTDTVLTSATIPGPVLREAMATITDLLAGHFYFAAEQALPGPIAATGLFPEPGFVPPERPVAQVADEPLFEIPGVVKLLVRTEGDSDETAELANVVSAALGGSLNVTHASRTHQMLEISRAGVDKAAALASLAADWSIPPEQIAAAGDMPNDIPMIRWAGHGAAVASAHTDVVAAADEVIADPEHDGVADLLGRLNP